MSKTITIPSDRGSVIKVEVNGRGYIYKAGASVTVPDEEAEAIANALENDPVYGRLATSPLGVEDLYEGDDFIPVFVTTEGRLRIRKSDIQALIPDPPAPELPDMPDTDGTYTLTMTVDSGEGTLGWAEENTEPIS